MTWLLRKLRELSTEVVMQPDLPQWETVGPGPMQLWAEVRRRVQLAEGELSPAMVELRLAMAKDGDHEGLQALDKLMAAERKRVRRRRRNR